VMTQVELPPYCGPHSPLDLVAIEIIFGRIFEAFRQMTQATAADTVLDAIDKPLLKKPCRLPLKRALVPRYSDTFFLDSELLLF
jgi:hypothetical protein